MRGAHDGRMNGFSVITQRTSFAAHIKSSITQTCNKIHTDTLERSRKKMQAILSKLSEELQQQQRPQLPQRY